MGVLTLMSLFFASYITLELHEPLSPPGFFKGRFRLVCPDGTFLILNKTMFFHFDTQGRFIQKVGKKGEGPGEFVYIFTGFWDGNRYYIRDSDRTRSIAIFDREGKLEEEIKLRGNIDKIGHTGRSFYAFHLGSPPPKPHLGLVEFNRIEELRNPNKLKHFHPTSVHVTKYKFNNDNHWLVFFKGKLYVADEIAPEVHVYSQDYQRLQKVELVLPEFVPSPDKWVSYKGTTRIQRREWFHSWSRLQGFAVNEKGMLIAYEVPHEADPQNTLLAVVQVGFDGKPITRMKKYDAEFMGTHGGSFYLFREVDEEQVFPQYTVEIKPW